VNRIASLRTVRVQETEGGDVRFAVVIGVDLHDVTNADDFIAEVAKKFLCQRMISPVETDLLVITLNSPLPVEYFAYVWKQLALSNSILRYDMQRFRHADVIRGTPRGVITETASLLLPHDKEEAPTT
jgi:hypothetical protein